MAYFILMADPLHTVVETPQFLRDAAAVGMSEAERKNVVDLVAASPKQGLEIQGSGGVRKIRVAGRGKGKSGGYRIIAAYFGNDAPTYLLALLSKGDRANFSDAEIAGFKALTALIGKHWQERKRT
jgi:hypothetical protein